MSCTPQEFYKFITFQSSDSMKCTQKPHTQSSFTFERNEIAHIKDAVDLHSSGQKANISINCTGLMAFKLGGVEDKSVYPASGQLRIVKNYFEGLFTTSGSDDGPFETIYVQPRMGGGSAQISLGCRSSNERRWSGSRRLVSEA